MTWRLPDPFIAVAGFLLGPIIIDVDAVADVPVEDVIVGEPGSPGEDDRPDA